ncbi:JmjC domain-containing protein [Qipengyuania sp.]|uniref:JmjC domain-containing protein n=1 Tax=Qipengyuania sp. TaxID=2004515 RepID=UPI0035C85C89
MQNFDAAAFLRDCWQKQPLLIRNPWGCWTNPLEPDELAGLACQAEVESRLVRQVAQGGWTVQHGPFGPESFGDLGATPWTLLVHAVDHHIDEVAALIEPFRFIPDWRIDDVMVSYAVEGGGVGPHFDQYDVFLVQGLGQRRWRIGKRHDSSARLLPHDDLRLLADFEPLEEWVLDPGDILYVPPGYAHDGVAVGDDCMTYSVGFRAPSRGDLVSAWADHLLDTLDEDDRYTDPNLSVGAPPGEISSAALARLQAMVSDALTDRTAFAAWFGRYVTRPKEDGLDWAPEQHVTAADLTRERAPLDLARNPASRFSFVRESTERLVLFVDGEAYVCQGTVARMAERLCAEPRIIAPSNELASQDVAGLIIDLLNRGCLAIIDSD